MSRIRSKNTKPELVLRRGLHARGRRYRLHAAGLPGKPDMVFPGRRAAVLVHGCFWHGHDCPLFRMPATRVEFWEQKIRRNRANDALNITGLAERDWRVLTVWECALRGRGRRPVTDVLDAIEAWIDAGSSQSSIAGVWNRNGQKTEPRKK